MSNKIEIPLTPVTSSQIQAIGFDEPSGILAIQFIGKNGQPGSIYHYANFTRELYVEFASAPSLGSWFYQNVKHNAAKHPYTKQ